ncbi:NAD(P)-dependent dehydrogenase (short-subunit alcohol dehydrogenase family) [Pseudomonas sp. JUb96]|nr:NAD(P)-dependent dehydrogenase (short-subunit alcohol dehydrogenase family) [Pseudomonas sp. JUb96]
MKIDLSAKTALVTGSTVGIGFAIAKGLAEAGADVIVNGRSQPAVDAAVAAIQQSCAAATVRGVVADVGNADGCAQLVSQLPQVDILINNVGIYARKTSSTHRTRSGSAFSM